MKVSHYIHYPEACRFLVAVEQSQLAGRPVNTLTTVNLEQLGIPPVECSHYLRYSLQKLRKLFERQGCPWCVAWVLENSKRNGVHAHILIHRNPPLISDWRAFRVLVLKAFNQLKPPPRAIRSCKFRTWFQSYEQSRGNLENYLLKGIRPEVAGLLDINATPQGVIYGKRVGTSNI
ncbi:MAG: hypothetical protein CMN55_08395 [Sneathiella sp.]|nr:hypothetical protein [Sneathiella sp.]|tara:strand:+ start:2807 stop:3334 length:528 start_codon:yes stop_codon:yes gene_type:complete